MLGHDRSGAFRHCFARRPTAVPSLTLTAGLHSEAGVAWLRRVRTSAGAVLMPVGSDSCAPPGSDHARDSLPSAEAEASVSAASVASPAGSESPAADLRLLLQTPQGHPALCTFKPHRDRTRYPSASDIGSSQHLPNSACRSGILPENCENYLVSKITFVQPEVGRPATEQNLPTAANYLLNVSCCAPKQKIGRQGSGFGG